MHILSEANDRINLLKYQNSIQSRLLMRTNHPQRNIVLQQLIKPNADGILRASWNCALQQMNQHKQRERIFFIFNLESSTFDYTIIKAKNNNYHSN